VSGLMGAPPISNLIATDSAWGVSTRNCCLREEWTLGATGRHDFSGFSILALAPTVIVKPLSNLATGYTNN
ncbi:MAG: hypothetical protein L7S45_00220, partial [Luminiphilus sp.]|nr:hypothetical protein [Luminiphilus sp.]